VGDCAAMELHDAIRRRAMVRSFATTPVEPTVLGHILEAALRAPTAGNTRGTAWLALVGPEQTAVYWATTTDPAWRSRNAERAEGLRRAPVALLSYCSPAAYVARYGEPDKANDPDLGARPEAWPVPYWHGDAAFGVMSALLAAVDAGLGACFLGAFRGEGDLARALGVPDQWRLFGALVLGHPDGKGRRSASLDRPGPEASARLHWGAWNGISTTG
jgi:nitroreductase